MRFVSSKLYKTAHLSLLAALVASIAFFGWPLYIKHAENSSLEALARYPHDITGVEVLRLSDTGESGPEGSYLVRLDHSRRGIAARRILNGAQAEELIRTWGSVRIAEGSGGAMCHEPGFVLRFLDGQRSVFEVAVCFHCSNVSWQSAPFITSVRGMVPTVFDKDSGTEALKTFLTQLP
jgi:hypothetical protein